MFAVLAIERAFHHQLAQGFATRVRVDFEFQHRRVEIGDATDHSLDRVATQHGDAGDLNARPIEGHVEVHCLAGGPVVVELERGTANSRPGVQTPDVVPERPVIEIAANADAPVQHPSFHQGRVQPADGGLRHPVQDPELLRRRETRGRKIRCKIEHRRAAVTLETELGPHVGAKIAAFQLYPVESDVPSGPGFPGSNGAAELQVHRLAQTARPIHADRRRLDAHHAATLVELDLSGETRDAWALGEGLQFKSRNRHRPPHRTFAAADDVHVAQQGLRTGLLKEHAHRIGKAITQGNNGCERRQVQLRTG